MWHLVYGARMVTVQEVQVDAQARRAWCRGQEMTLSRKEFDLLHALISRAGEVVTRDELMRSVWKTDFWGASKTLDVHLGWLRRKLGEDGRNPHYITTVRGMGLRFEAGTTQGKQGKAGRRAV